MSVSRKLALIVPERHLSQAQTKKRMVNYSHLFLRHNLFLEVNFTLIMEQFADLKTVDIRDNPIHGEGVGGVKYLEVLTDCDTFETDKGSQDNDVTYDGAISLPQPDATFLHQHFNFSLHRDQP